jgi:hypothetical protein
MVAAGLGRYLAESRVTEGGALAGVKLALQLGGEINAVNDSGNNALHGAAHTKANEVIRFLADKTPLMIADTVRAGSATVSQKTETGELLRRLGAESGTLEPPRR